jgi:hypothetical protein
VSGELLGMEYGRKGSQFPLLPIVQFGDHPQLRCVPIAARRTNRCVSQESAQLLDFACQPAKLLANGFQRFVGIVAPGAAKASQQVRALQEPYKHPVTYLAEAT